MMIAALLEPTLETRVAITPNSAKNYIKQGFTVGIEKNAGLASGYTDNLYEEVGVEVFKTRKSLLKQTNVLLCVNEPDPKVLENLAKGSIVIAHIDNDPKSAVIKEALNQELTLFSMNLIPRLSRAQSMDSLSSQANLAGYRGVLAGVNAFHKAVPMMMTAAGMIQPAKILILGAGVAGLQAIATPND